ncbi:HlyD family efflux transporter periplasmic adaptor subunit [Neolewinella aurantiaca]|uniref:HlyD family efflux transporter periplasmic adaptor subunit n=1 Tax=Neolewinella aurantiaca TaxID=2602767 RepID=A0A5C7FYZ5_9BACT|nr:HlyD family efflux transporter periplasmic adaptor subunit [Neolewinella aurantiaca]TXF90441.1 HlyD family efflux transporter periplasmic adaptor subunit [Neolewinella aurantiaca]
MNLSALEKVDLPNGQYLFRRWIMVGLIFFLILCFMPWTQNFRAKGNVTSLGAADRPQSVHATIPGRVEAWYLLEGDTVRRGDTIARLSEVKSDYFDPQLIERTAAMRDAKSNSADGYLAKAAALDRQIATMRQELVLKLEQGRNKLEQSRLYVSTLEADLAQQEAQVAVAAFQEARTDSLYGRGLKSLSDAEAKLLKTREARAKLTALQNKLDQAKTEVEQTELSLATIEPTYQGKIAKAQGDRQSAMTQYYTAVGDVAKLETSETNYRIRRDFGYVTAPQDGVVGKILTPGIGETVKEGEAIVTILPRTFRSAVEMFVEPFNLPLVSIGQEVRFIFDGWPAVVFSGWPGMSYGTFTGSVVAIDNTVDRKGLYRVLVAPSEDGRSWPTALRPGSGAEGVVLLGNVPLWYEGWRQLNAFPPDFYQVDRYQTKSEEGLKVKAPVRTVIK